MTKTSLITLTRNGIKYTRMCVESVFRNTSEPFELIVVDQGSTDGTVEYLQRLQRDHTHVKIVTNHRDIGFAAGNNRAAKLAEGPILVFLNNDVIVSPYWLGDLTRPLVEDSTLAATGPTSNATGELQFDRHSIGRIRRIPDDIESYAAAKRQLMIGRTWYFHRLAGFCLSIKKEVFEETGGFDERLTYFEDDYLCRRIVEKGHRLAIIPSVFVYHFGSSTFKALGLNVDMLMQVNRTRYIEHVMRPEAPRKLIDHPKVTVITTTFNRPRELETALQSIRAQTYHNWEAIVVNDGGQDVSHVIEGLDDKRFKYTNSKHLGRPEALNLGLKQATGKYVAYLDDDDIWYPDHLQLCVAFLERNPQIGLAYTKAVRKTYRRSTDGTMKCINDYIDPRMEFDQTRLFDGNWIPIPSVMHRHDLLQQVHAFRELPILEDYDFLFRLSSLAEFAHLPVVTGEYFVDITKISRNERLRKENPRLYNETLAQITTAQTACETSERLRIAAQEFHDLGQDAQAFKLADRALRVNPLNYLALKLYIATHEYGSDRYLVSRLEHFLREKPDRSDIWKSYALEVLKKEQYLKALRALEMALATRETEDEAASLYRLLSTCYFELGARDTAAACALKSKEIEMGTLPSNADLPALPEGAILDQWFERGILALPFKGLSYYYLYSRRWGHRAAIRKIAGEIATHHKKMR